MAPAIPEWVPRVDRALRVAVRSHAFLGALSPINALEERRRLVQAFSNANGVMPCWRYRTATGGEPLFEMARALAPEQESPLKALYVARLAELQGELRMLAAAGTRDFSRIRMMTFPVGASLTEVAEAWVTPRRNEKGPLLECDSPEEGSLLTKVRAWVSRHRLPVRVQVEESLGSLAATGEGVILIAKRRRITEEVAERTAIHEVLGHALPRERARQASLGIFVCGTRGGVVEQEGYALVLEEEHGFLSHARKRELGLRHLWAAQMFAGASFVDVVRGLVEEGEPVEDAVRLGERLYRGSDGTFPGLGREHAYLPAYLRVKAHLEQAPGDRAVFETGQVAVDAVPVLRPFVA